MQAMATETFIGNMRGPIIRRRDADYDAVRSLYNGMIDKSPVMIARCTDVADVVTAVNFARENDLQVAIRGGGHNGPGLGSVDDGLMIDMSMMKGVRVDPAARTVRVGPGCTQGDVDHATHIYRARRAGRHRLDDGYRRPHAGRRHWIPHPQARPHHRQSARGGCRARRRSHCHREQVRER